MLLSRLRHRRDEEGVAMVTVVILILVCFTVVSVIAASTIFGVHQTSGDRSRLQALAAAEGGRDYAVSQLTTDTCSPTSPSYSRATPSFTATVFPSTASTAPSSAQGLTPGCPAAGTTYVVVDSTGRAPDGTAKEVMATYPWAAPPPQQAIIDGAIIEGGSASVDVTSAQIYHGDLVMNTTGTVSCTTSGTFDGDLVVPQGSVVMSNNCHVTGSIIAGKDITLQNVTVGVGKDVISTGGNVTIGGSIVGGDVKAYGFVNVNNPSGGNAEIDGNVIAEGNGTSSKCNGSAVASEFTGNSSTTTVVHGSMTIGGALCDLNVTKVWGAIVATGAGVTSIGANGPAVTAPGGIKLAGTCNPCTATPAPVQNVTNLTAPTFPPPVQMSYPTWADYPFTSSDWTGAGYQVIAANQVRSGDTGCSYAGDAALVAALAALPSNTVVDARSCSSLNLGATTLAISRNVTFLATTYNAQTLTVNSGDGSSHYFNLITPDATPDGKPSCGGSASTVSGATLGTGISGIAYTPCTLSWGSVSSNVAGTQWNGQIVAGDPDFSGGTSAISFSLIPLPGMQTSPGLTVTSSAPGGLTPTLVSQTEP